MGVEQTSDALSAPSLCAMWQLAADEDLPSTHFSWHKLGLSAWPMLQDVCIALELPDAMQLPSALRDLLQAVATIPKLERFVGDVCEVWSLCRYPPRSLKLRMSSQLFMHVILIVHNDAGSTLST